MGAERHAFLTAGGDDGRITQHDVLRAKRDRPQARAADLVQTPGGGFDRQAGADMRLAGRVLALGRGQHLAKNGFGHLGLVDAGAGNEAFENGGAQFMGGGVGERAKEAADRGAARRYDHYVRHGVFPSG